MSSREASLAKTLVQQERAQGSKESEADSGQKWHGSFAKWDPATCSWRTHQYSLVGDLEPFSATWPRWGTMRNGACWERTMSEHHTSETGSGYWQTPVADDAVNRKAGKFNSRGGTQVIGSSAATYADGNELRDQSRRIGGENRQGAPQSSDDGEKEPLAHADTIRRDGGTGTGKGPTGRG